MRINVLGLGESLSAFTDKDSVSIGVNDIYSRFATDYVVCVDHPTAFSFERLETIKQTNCKGFYSQVDFWSFLPNYNKIEFNRGRGILDGLNSDRFCYSNSSPYVAVILAYKLGAKQIVLYGVDFQSHVNFEGNSKNRAVNDLINLSKELKKYGVELFVGSEFSALFPSIPLFEPR